MLNRKVNIDFYVYDDFHRNCSCSSSFITDINGYAEQHIQYLPFGELFVSQQNTSFDTRYKFTAKEHDQESNYTYFGARYYDSDLSVWLSVDPMADQRSWVSPYSYCQNNPVMRVDPTGALDAPIYDIDGNFLGTDDEGLQGKAIVMDKKDFKQGMSHTDALSKSKGYEGLSTQDAKNKFNTHFDNLPNRPDYDGYLTLDEANKWYRDGNGEPLFTSLEKINLSGIASLGEKYVGQVKTFNLLFYSASLNDGLVYGSITLKRYPNHSVRAFSDEYDFKMHNPWNPLNWGRNAQTAIGRKVAGVGNPFEINIYGSKKLAPFLPWTK